MSTENIQSTNGSVSYIAYLLFEVDLLYCVILYLKLVTKALISLYQMTLENVMKTYASCISGLRISQAQRRVTSFKLIPLANFTNEVYCYQLHKRQVYFFFFIYSPITLCFVSFVA